MSISASRTRIDRSADVSPSAIVGDRTRIWNAARVRENATIGDDCTIGSGAYIDQDVTIGDACKVQNNALVYWPARIGRGVFIGPGAIITNDRIPRAVNPDLSPKTLEDWEPAGVEVGDGASIGAGAIIMAGVRIGAWSMVGAGAVVTSDLPAHAVAVGVPAAVVGWVGRSGHRLVADGDMLVDPETDDRFRMVDGLLELA